MPEVNSWYLVDLRMHDVSTLLAGTSYVVHPAVQTIWNKKWIMYSCKKLDQESFCSDLKEKVTYLELITVSFYSDSFFEDRQELSSIIPIVSKDPFLYSNYVTFMSCSLITIMHQVMQPEKKTENRDLLIGL